MVSRSKSIAAASWVAAALMIGTAARAQGEPGGLLALEHGQAVLLVTELPGKQARVEIRIASGRAVNSVALDRDEARQFLYAWEWAKKGLGRTKSWRRIARVWNQGIDSAEAITLSSGLGVRMVIASDGSQFGGPTVTFDLAPREVARFDAALTAAASHMGLISP